MENAASIRNNIRKRESIFRWLFLIIFIVVMLVASGIIGFAKGVREGSDCTHMILTISMGAAVYEARGYGVDHSSELATMDYGNPRSMSFSDIEREIYSCQDTYDLFGWPGK